MPLVVWLSMLWKLEKKEEKFNKRKK